MAKKIAKPTKKPAAAKKPAAKKPAAKKSAAKKPAAKKPAAETAAKTPAKTSGGDPIAVLLAKYKGQTLTYGGHVNMFAADQEVKLDADGAQDRLADDETESAKSETAIGWFSGLPLVVDTSKAKLPVRVYLEGRPVEVAASLAAFEKNLAKPEPAPVVKKGAKLLEPETVKGYAMHWPKSDYYVLLEWPSMHGDDRNPFLWIAVTGGNRDLYYSNMRDHGNPVADRWQSKTEKLDRGTGAFLDVAWFTSGSMRPPIVTPRVRALFDQLPMTGVEFLPLRANVKGQKGDYFVVHITRMLECLDEGAAKMHDDSGVQTPTRLVFKKGSVPDDAHLFRMKAYPDTLLASSALVDLLRDQHLSGLDFIPIKEWKSRMYR